MPRGRVVLYEKQMNAGRPSNQRANSVPLRSWESRENDFVFPVSLLYKPFVNSSSENSKSKITNIGQPYTASLFMNRKKPTTSTKSIFKWSKIRRFLYANRRRLSLLRIYLFKFINTDKRETWNNNDTFYAVHLRIKWFELIGLRR